MSVWQAVVLLGGNADLADKLARKWPLLVQPPGKTVLLPEVYPDAVLGLEISCLLLLPIRVHVKS